MLPVATEMWCFGSRRGLPIEVAIELTCGGNFERGSMFMYVLGVKVWLVASCAVKR